MSASVSRSVPETPLEEMARFVAGLRPADLPPEVVSSVRLHFLDTVGVALAAVPGAAARALKAALRESGGKPQAAPIGSAERLPAEHAAFLGATLAHGLDFDDTHLPSIVHPSAFVVPAALSVGQAVGASGAEVVTAAAAGYEILIRLGMAAYDPALRDSVFFAKGLHGASLCGAVGAAATAARLLGLDARATGHALAVAASFASGLLEGNRTGGNVKQVQAGWACQTGVWAAKLGRAGVTGPRTIWEGRFGFFQALADGRYDPSALTDDLGERWAAAGISVKPYPANHFTHAAIDAALALRARMSGFEAEEVERIELGVAGSTLRTIAEPREAKVAPESGYAARFSGPFVVATALLGGGGLGVYLDDFTDELAKEPARRALAAKVTCFADPECESVYPMHFPAVLRIVFRSGEVLEERVMENRGSPARPLSTEEVLEKFRLNATRLLPAREADRIASLCTRLEGLDGLGELVDAWRVGEEAGGGDDGEV